MEAKLFGHLIGCPLCHGRFYMPDPSRRPSGWQSFLSGFLVPFVAMAKFAKRYWNDLMSNSSGGQVASHLSRSSHGMDLRHDDMFFEFNEEANQYDDMGEDGSGYNSEDDAEESLSSESTYYDSHGAYVGYRDESGWFHGEGGDNYMGYMEDDGSFYDGSGMYHGQVEDGGLVWEEGEGYTGFHEDNHFSEEGHYGVPDVYEDGGEGTGGAFNSLMEDEDVC